MHYTDILKKRYIGNEDKAKRMKVTENAYIFAIPKGVEVKIGKRAAAAV